ncbi:hypothetical protein DFJ73DRAFT_956821 [Zopfochytrium polystomum]|nr:hypothetical protein DFJ73DRAFT_956821 [Zopfochytrium polystomum]
MRSHQPSSHPAFLFSYSGNCHCGAFCFDLRLAAPLPHPFESSPPPPPSSSEDAAPQQPTTPLPLYACPCAICTMKGCVLLPFGGLTGDDASSRNTAAAAVVDFSVSTGAGTDGLGLGPLVDFAAPNHRGRHRFCGTCGTPVAVVETGDGSDGDERTVRVLALNVRTVRHGRELRANGADGNGSVDATSGMPPPAPLWELPPLLALDLRTTAAAPQACARPHNDDDGNESFAAVAEAAAAYKGERVYAGGCFCRAVTYRVRTLPLDDPAVEMGSILTYPRPLDRVAVHQTGADALVTYFYALGTKFVGFQFCRFCGVNTCNRIVGPPEDMLATRSEAFRAMVREKVSIKPVNVRTMDFFLDDDDKEARDERDKVLARVERTTMGSKQGKMYVVPAAL